VTGVTAEEEFATPVRALHLTDAQQLARERPIDIAFVCVKSYDTEWATMLIRQYLAPGGFVVSLQNCMNEERIAGIVGWGRTVGCIASKISVELHAPGAVRRGVEKGGASYTIFRVGEVHGRITDRVEEVRRLVALSDSAKTTPNLWGERWSKLVANSMQNGLSACTGLSGNQMMRIDAIRRFAVRLGSEAIRVGQAQGYTLEDILRIPPETLARAGEGDGAALATAEEQLLSGAKKQSETQRPSMGQDMMKGRRTEITFLNGFVVDKGREVGIEARANAALTDIVQRVERGEIPADPRHIIDLRLN
ncbi:MAG: 2-dehydropantoate 2-reductase, partial [Alphaproteobacteria bacterium]|nr:2-dehydropantoate 2-reductase [Alphaproteobacteria bacterium]